MNNRMQRMLLLACAAVLAVGGEAAAQSPGPGPGPGPARPGMYATLPPGQIVAIVRASGFAPLFRPMRRGDAYVLRAVDRNGIEYRLIVDAYTGRTMSLRPLGAAGPYRARSGPYGDGPAYGPNGGPIYGRVFGPAGEGARPDGYGAPSPPADLTRPVQPPAAKAEQAKAAPTKPEQTKAGQAPLPRPRPYTMEATTSTPAAAAPPAAPPAPSAPAAPPAQTPPAAAPAPAAPPAHGGGSAIPPVAPLD